MQFDTPTPMPQGLTIIQQIEFKRMEGQRQLRVGQFKEDLLEALTSLDPALYKKFVLRWGLSHPPGGWEDLPPIVAAIHAQILVNGEFDDAAKLRSARAMLAMGYKLPPGVSLEGDVLTGHITSKLNSAK